MSTILPFLIPLHLILAAEDLNGMKCPIDGPHSIQLSTGRTVKYRCKKNQLEGPYKAYSKSGKLVEEGLFRAGLLEGERRVKPYGTGGYTILNYRKGRLSGKTSYVKAFSRSLVQETEYKNDRRGPLATLFSHSGEKKEERPFKNGLADGKAVATSKDRPPFLGDIKFSWRQGRVHGEKITPEFQGGKTKRLLYDQGRRVSSEIPSQGILVKFGKEDKISLARYRGYYRHDYSKLAQMLPKCTDNKQSDLLFAPVYEADVAIYRCQKGKPNGPLQLQSALQSSPEFGMLIFKATLNSGILNGPYEIYRLGALLEQGRFENGIRHGVVAYYDDGILLYRRKYNRGEPELAVTYFDPSSLNIFRSKQKSEQQRKMRLEKFKNAVCDSPTVPWDENVCMIRSRRAPSKKTGLEYLRVGCAQKVNPACLELGTFSDAEQERKKLWNQACQNDSKLCFKYAKALVYLGRSDLIYELLTYACRYSKDKSKCRDIEKYKAMSNRPK